MLFINLYYIKTLFFQMHDKRYNSKFRNFLKATLVYSFITIANLAINNALFVTLDQNQPYVTHIPLQTQELFFDLQHPIFEIEVPLGPV